MRTWNEILSDSVLQAVDPSIEELETYLTDYQEVTNVVRNGKKRLKNPLS